MEVILLERVESLGQMGDTVKVKNGYARNYLIPQKKAMRATRENQAYFESQRAQLEANNLERRQEAEAVSSKMAGTSIVVIRSAGEAGHLYGSVTARDMAQALTEVGFTVDRQQVAVDRPIKMLGLFDVRIVLHPEVSVSVEVNVARSVDEAALQKKRGGAITGELDRDDDEDETDELMTVSPEADDLQPAPETTEEATEEQPSS